MSKRLFNWLDKRASGVLLHPTSLPGEFGIGTLNDHCRDFIDFLAASGFSYWQVCPLGPTGYGDSPYQSFSSFAGNPYLISFNELNAKELLSDSILQELQILPTSFVDYGGLYLAKWPVLRAVYHRFVTEQESVRPYGRFSSFKSKHASWLDPFAYFQALKQRFEGAAWPDWPAELRDFEKAQKSKLRTELAEEIDAQKFYQYLFFGQWYQIREYANTRGIQIIGDVPIFVALDSSDVWQNQHLFQFDRKKTRPTAVAGCPPDYFSEDGQLWGNPLYDWEALREDDYNWWAERLKANFALCDVVRIDHFRGFDSYWKIPYDSKTAKIGKWMEGPGIEFFKVMKKKIKSCKLIAEDLGELTESVRELRAATGLPGMAILQFAFGGEADNLYLPHNLERNTILYPGTHDNDTTIGWYKSIDEKTKDHARKYYGINGEEISWDFIRSAYQSVANLAIIPFQDILSLGSEARFNTPGKAEGNWSWRYKPEQLDKLKGETSSYLMYLSEIYGRS